MSKNKSPHNDSWIYLIPIVICFVIFFIAPEIIAWFFSIATIIFILVFFVAFVFSGFDLDKAKAKLFKEKSTKKKSSQSFDSCSKPVCFHKDKGEHHVRKGKDVDPWDRPDIDIRKYQR